MEMLTFKDYLLNIAVKRQTPHGNVIALVRKMHSIPNNVDMIMKQIVFTFKKDVYDAAKMVYLNYQVYCLKHNLESEKSECDLIDNGESVYKQRILLMTQEQIGTLRERNKKACRQWRERNKQIALEKMKNKRR